MHKAKKTKLTLWALKYYKKKCINSFTDACKTICFNSKGDLT